MSEEMMSAREAAEKWGITQRRINQLCNSGNIDGAVKDGGLWRIPSSAPRPESLRAGMKRAGRLQTTKLLPCPVGISSFREVSSECYYVDKTLIIKDIIDEHSKVTLFTRPRRFGKTLTMDMVKTYFEKTEEDTSVYFRNWNIWKSGEAYRSYQGKYPVIFISFKDAHQKSWKEMYESLSLVLQSEFRRHLDILESSRVSDIDKTFFSSMLKGDVSGVECESSLGRLSHILSAAYSSRVIVIIDEYDTPIEQGYGCGYYNEVISFMRNLFSSVLKDNADLEFGLLTGILRVAKESLFSGLNNLVVNTLLDTKYSDYFGFSESEVESMTAYYGCREKFDEIRDWYDGYLFGKTEIYNPWSVISYINNRCVPKAFWSRTSSNDMILDIIRNGGNGIRDDLVSLLQDIPVEGVIDSDIIYPEIESTEDSVYSFLLMTGYLKVVRVLGTISDNPVCSMVIPNREIKGVFRKEILDNLSASISQSVIRSFQLALRGSSSEELERTLSDYLLTAASYFDTASESFYHGMMFGLLAVMSDDYLITSNRESGEGRFDIILKPRVKTRPGIIMEFKACVSSDDAGMAVEADDAVKQIIGKKYDVGLRAEGVNDIQLYGIAFAGKKAAVKTEHMN